MQIAVLVENREHAQKIKALMPEAGVQVQDTTPESTAAQEKGRVVIITAVAAYNRGIGADLVIAASGGEALLEIRNFPGTTTENTPVQPKIIVEIAGGLDGMSKATRMRFDLYRKAKWKVHLPEQDNQEIQVSEGGKEKRKQERKQPGNTASVKRCR